MKTETLKNILSEDREAILLVDVREEEERLNEPYFEILPENYLPIPLAILSILSEEELAQRIDSAKSRLHRKDQDIRIVTLCRSGRRSEMACPYFSRLGLPVESLEGGYESWIMGGRGR